MARTLQKSEAFGVITIQSDQLPEVPFIRFVPPTDSLSRSSLVVYVWLTVVLNPFRFASRLVALSTALWAVFAVDEILALKESEVAFRLVRVAYVASACALD